MHLSNHSMHDRESKFKHLSMIFPAFDALVRCLSVLSHLVLGQTVRRMLDKPRNHWVATLEHMLQSSLKSSTKNTYVFTQGV